MALSDPFSTTYEGARQGLGTLGEGILQAAGLYAQKKQQERERNLIRNQGQNLLRQFGIIDSYGNIDKEKSKDMGIELKSSGEVTIKPMHQLLSPMQQVQDIISAQQYAKSKGIIEPLKISETQKGITLSTGSTGQAGVTPQEDIKASVEGAFQGTVPPERLASWRDVTRVNAEIKRQSEKNGMNFPDLMLEWDATKKFVQSAQATQQIRLRQAIDFAQQSTQNLKKLSQEFKRGDFPILNKAKLTLAMNGAYGQDIAKKATIFNQQLTDIVADLGNVYMGGNSPTDEGLKLAQQNLRSNWSIEQLDAAIDNVDKLLIFRSNAIKSAAPAYGGQYGTKYYPQPNVINTPQVQAIQGGQKIQYSQEDLEYTAKKRGISVAEVKRKLRIQ